MAVLKRTVDIPLGGGLDQKTGEVVQQPPKLGAVLNGRYVKSGTVELRQGYTAFSASKYGGGSVAAGCRLAALDDEILLSDGQYLYAWLAASSAWRQVDRLPEATIQDEIAGTERGLTVADPGDAVYCGGVWVFAYVLSAGLYAVSVDAATGSRYPLATIQGSSVSGHVRLCVLGTKVFAFFYDSTNTDFYCSYLNTALMSGGWSAPTRLTTDASSSLFDACSLSNTHMALVYHAVTDGATLCAKKIDSAPAVVATHVFGSAAPTFLGVGGYGSTMVYVAYSLPTPTGLVAYGFDQATWGGLSFAETAIDTAIYSGGGTCAVVKIGVGTTADGTSAMVAYSLYEHLETQVRARLVSSAGAVSMFHRTYGVVQISRPFYRAANTQWYLYARREPRTLVSGTALFNSAVGDQPYEYLMEVQTTTSSSNRGLGRVVARLRTGFAEQLSYIASANPLPASITSPSTNTYSALCGDTMVRVDFTPGKRHLPVKFGDIVVFSGGHPAVYDGDRVYEYGFHHYPVVTRTAAGAAGALVPGSTYSWTACFVWQDTRGNTHRSIPAEPITYQMGGAETSVDIAVECCHLTEREDDDYAVRTVTLELYRTPAGGGNYYLVATTNNLRKLQGRTFTDISSDATILANAGLYTNGVPEVPLDNAPPPCAWHMAMHNDRLWVLSGDDPEIVWFSKVWLSGETPGFSEALTLRVSGGGDGEAIHSTGDALAVFKRSEIHAVYGYGPSDTGTGNDIQARWLTGDQGCIDRRSVVGFRGGVAFRSQQGIYQLGRDGSLGYLGADAEDETGTLTTNLEVTSAQLVESEGELRFTVRGDDDTGSVLVYSYTLNAWAKWAIYDATGGTGWASAVVGRYSGAEAYMLLGTNGGVLRETPGVYSDPNSTYPALTITTPWLHLTGLQGYQRVLSLTALGKWLGTHSLAATIYYDYSSTSGDTASWTSGEVTALKNGDRYQVRIDPTRQKCEAIRLTLTTTQLLSSQAVRWEGLTLDYGAYRGPNRLAAGARR